MLVSELDHEQILPGMRIKGFKGAIGRVESIDYLDDRYAWVSWDNAPPTGGFYGNDCDVEVIDGFGAHKLDEAWAAGVLLFNDQDDEVLVIQRANKDGDFGIPGGKREKGETPLECAVRECKEEAGVILDPHRLEVVWVRPGHPDDPPFATFIGVVKKSTPLISSNEGAVRWGPQRLLRLGSGTFREHNKKLLDMVQKPRDLQGWL